MLRYYLKVNGRIYGGTYSTLAEARVAHSEATRAHSGALVEVRGIRN